MSIWRFANDFEAVPPESQLTLGEGDTPMVRSRSIGPQAGLDNLFFKLEMCNPTGSYKDRFAFCAVSHMLASGQKRCLATTSGNTGSSLAAYCAIAGIDCQIAVVEAAPLGKLQQMISYGAKIIRVKRFGVDPQVNADVFQTLLQMGSAPEAAMQVSAFKYSPLGMSGVRTLGVELRDWAELNSLTIGHIFTQAGGGGLSQAIAQIQLDMAAQSRIERAARVECVQPLGNNTIAGPLSEGREVGQDVDCTTRISGLQVASVVDADRAIHACRATGGTGHLVSDELVWEIQKRMAREEGIFSEPAGAAATAGVVQAASAGKLDRSAVVVSLVTGGGFKDPASVERMTSDYQCPEVAANQLKDSILAGSFRDPHR